MANNFKYHVMINYVPARARGQEFVNISGTTHSVPTYSEPYYVAAMPEIKIGATGSNYTEALDNLIIAASASGTGQEPLSEVRNW